MVRVTTIRDSTFNFVGFTMRIFAFSTRGALISLSAAAVFSSMISAGERSSAPKRPGFKTMDADGDGALTQREFRGPEAAFKRMDEDGDGKLTPSEMRSFREKREERFKRFGRATGSKRSRDSYPNLNLEKHVPEKAWKGNVIFVDNLEKRVVEVDRKGRMVWEVALPSEIVAPTCSTGACSFARKGGCASLVSDVELLPGGTMLIMAGGRGVYELDRKGNVVWSYENPAVSHDADRLPNGDTVMACAVAEKLSEFPYDDPQAIAVNKEGEVVWSWSAKDEYLDSEWKDVRSRDAGDWTHVNSVQRLGDGTTLVSVRNWNSLIAVDEQGKTSWKTGGGKTPHCPHTPVMLDDGTIIVSEPINGRVVIWDPKKKSVVWSWPKKTWREGGEYYFFRAAWPLPNGNVFMIDSLGRFIEVTRSGEVVWLASKPGFESRRRPLKKEELPSGSCYFNADVRGMKPYGGR